MSVFLKNNISTVETEDCQEDGLSMVST